MLYPTDLAMVLPGQEMLASKGYLEIGTLYWLSLYPGIDPKGNQKKIAGGWNSISPTEFLSLQKIIFYNNRPVVLQLKEAGLIFNIVRDELFSQEIGYITRVHQLINELLILISRKLTKQNVSHRDFPKTFLHLEESLRKDLSHQWTVEEMATLVGLGTTAFSDKVKSYTGFTPMNYLINIRISEAIKLLKKPEVNMTDIALVTGFYSSQHFSTTFKKLTGYTPSQFRKNNITKT
jgi:AraC-like DNA-binding protein